MLEYDIQATHINSIGVPGSPEDHSTRPLVLGEGVTCLALQHELTEDAGGEDSGTKKGEIVVLKQYSERSYPSSTEAVGQDSKRPRAYDFLAQEIHVLRHERLRSHENIIRLLFLAYTPGNEMPLLGLELAEHGSLDFVLRCPGYGPSILDRENLTLDIALGLQALHACNIVHGDLKSENVLVFSHPRRHIVAKLADFGGSCFLDQDESRGSRRGDGPLHHTEIWDSPEVLIGDGSIDWQKSDVYSFGLVVASLWMRTSTHQPWPLDPQFSTCVLEPLVQRSWYNGLPSWLAALKIWKLRRDSDDNSLVSEVSRFLKWTLEKEGSAIPFVLSLVQKTLKTLPYERSVILRTLHDMEGTCISPEVGDRLR
ncbi:kinase-like domain-containing protein [Leptodontidium sp. MPI-SDFR-AT-0119]|nr:kinase-like domain-containing protein [Leptodontidium sp. MPI-SDFR-AT-0119]